MYEELAESLWVGITGRAGAGDIIVGSDQEDQADEEDQAGEAFYRHIEAASYSQALIWGTSTTLISVGGTAQQGTGNPGGSWNVLTTTSFSK